jgi:hypothetical protein
MPKKTDSPSADSILKSASIEKLGLLYCAARDAASYADGIRRACRDRLVKLMQQNGWDTKLIGTIQVSLTETEVRRFSQELAHQYIGPKQWETCINVSTETRLDVRANDPSALADALRALTAQSD